MSALEIRKARADDEPAVIALSAHIWEGEDYVPRRFADWLADKHGQFTVVYEDDQLVGFSKLTRLAPDEWWLEGLRVDPAHRNRGIARLLHRYAVDLAEQLGSGMLRFATSGKNVAVHKLARETGFRLIHPFSMAEATAAPSTMACGDFKQVAIEERNQVETWLRQSSQFTAVGGLYEERWKWMRLLPQLERLILEDRVYWWGKEQEERLGVVLISTGDDIMLVNYIDAVEGTLAEILSDIKALARRCNFTQLRLKPPATDEWRDALHTARWRVEPYAEMWVFGRELVLPS